MERTGTQKRAKSLVVSLFFKGDNIVAYFRYCKEVFAKQAISLLRVVIVVSIVSSMKTFSKGDALKQKERASRAS